MKSKMFGLFATVKDLDKNIIIYKVITNTLRETGIAMYKPWIVDEYPLTKTELVNKVRAFVEGTNKQVRVIDFAVAEFSTKSRTVFYQTITALENKVPVLCVQRLNKKNKIPTNIFQNSIFLISTMITAKYVKALNIAIFGLIDILCG